MIQQPTTALHKRRFAANIPRYFIYKACEGFAFGLISTTWVIYLQQARGMSLTQVTMIDVAFWIAAAVGEVPTGIVADSYGRKLSLAIGAAVMSASILAWTFAPTLPLVMLAYMGLALGTTFLSGAQDALFYESVQLAGRGEEYTRLVGRTTATVLGAIAVGSVASGLLATLNLKLPFLVAGGSYLILLGIMLSFQESRDDKSQKSEKTGAVERKSYGTILRQSFAVTRSRPTLRYLMFYLAIMPLVAIILDTVFIQPQAVALGVPLAGLGVILMAIRLSNMVGSIWAHWLATRLGEARILYAAPLLIVVSLLLLAGWQILPSLIFVALISFVTAVLRPLVLARIQSAVANDISATILSLQHLILTLLAVIIEPILGYVTDQAGSPAAYVALACTLSILSLLLFWQGRLHFPEGKHRQVTQVDAPSRSDA